MKHSATTGAVMAAMVKAQAEMQGATKSSENPFFKSTYADLSAVMLATKHALHNHGLGIVQFPIAEQGRCGVETVLIHESGEWMSETCFLATSKEDPQGYGSAITYARRYGWQAVCGIPSEDDDGNSASKPPTQQNNNFNVSQKDRAWGLWEDKKHNVPENISNAVFTDLQNGYYAKVIDYLESI